MNLRPYQSDVCIKFYDALAAGHRRILLVAPTGAGKTVIGCAIIKGYVDRHQSVLMLAHRREIITQTSAKLFWRMLATGSFRPAIHRTPCGRCNSPRFKPSTPARYGARCRCRPPSSL